MADTQKNIKPVVKLTHGNIMKLGETPEEIRRELAALSTKQVTNSKAIIDFVTEALPVATKVVAYAAAQSKSREQATLHSASVGVSNELVRLSKAIEKWGTGSETKEKSANLFSRK